MHLKLCEGSSDSTGHYLPKRKNRKWWVEDQKEQDYDMQVDWVRNDEMTMFAFNNRVTFTSVSEYF